MARSAADISEGALRLLLADGIGPATLRKLRASFGADDAIVVASERELALVDGIGKETAAALRRAIAGANPDAERRAMASAGAALVMLGDADYPALLASIDDAPSALWVRGELKPQDRLAAAIVGSRKCTAYGREQAGRFAALLAQSGLTIVSGGAAGVDGEAHRGALRAGGRTIVVAGCGLAHCYPSEHAELFERVVQSGGALVSEFSMATPPAAGNFPRRNRIISGLSLGVLVIEAAQRSGALITARLAAEEHHREVMAIPGRIDSPASAGCLRAIKEGWAALVTDHADVLRQLDGSSQLVRGALEQAGQPGATSAATLFDGGLTEAQRAIVHVLRDGAEPLLVDQIAARTELPLNQVVAEITLLQIRGQVVKDWSGTVRLKQ